MHVISGKWHAILEHLKVTLEGYLGCNSWSAELLTKPQYLQVVSENVFPVYWFNKPAQKMTKFFSKTSSFQWNRENQWTLSQGWGKDTQIFACQSLILVISILYVKTQLWSFKCIWYATEVSVQQKHGYILLCVPPEDNTDMKDVGRQNSNSMLPLPPWGQIQMQACPFSWMWIGAC